MKKLVTLSIISLLIVGAFIAGVAVGKVTAQAKFVAAEEVKWDDLNGPKLGLLHGDYKKGPYGALLKTPAGYTSPFHAHTGTYDAVQISGTSSHWVRGEDGTKAKKMTPGSYWSMPAKMEHVSACAPGADCIAYMWQTKKFDVILGKEAKEAAAAKAGAGPGSAAKPAPPAKKL